MKFPEWDARPCGLSVRTDSLTVIVDLARIPPPVAEAFRLVLQVPSKPSGVSLPPTEEVTVTRAAKAKFESLYQSNPSQALQFATLLSAFFHEVRHVHDLRATWIGAELLLNDYKVYAGVQKVIENLSAWQDADLSRRILIPLSKSINEHSLDSSFPSDPIRLSLNQGKQVSEWWDARSSFRTIPGTSIRELYEALGFIVQIEWLAKTFGRDVANEISVKTLGHEPLASPYFRPAYLVATACQARGVVFDPEPHDLITLIVESLNVSGLDEAFSDGKPTEFHPGAWLDRFAHLYANISAKGKVASEHLARVAINLSLREVSNGDLASIIGKANEKISNLQKELLKILIDDGSDEPILLASEIEFDFYEMQRILSEGNSYFIPSNYIDMLMRGELHTVYTRIREEDGTLGDFLTPSSIPSNHVGGIRHASVNSQKMKILLGGRDLRSRNFFEERMFQTLKGKAVNEHGLKFSRIND